MQVVNIYKPKCKVKYNFLVMSLTNANLQVQKETMVFEVRQNTGVAYGLPTYSKVCSYFLCKYAN